MFLLFLFLDGISLVSFSLSFTCRMDDSHDSGSPFTHFSFSWHGFGTKSASGRGHFLPGGHAGRWCGMSVLCCTVLLLVVYARLCHSSRHYLVLCTFSREKWSWLAISSTFCFELSSARASNPSLNIVSTYLPPFVRGKQIGIASRLGNPSDALLNLYGHTIVDAMRYACYMLAGTLGSLLLPCIVIWLARELCVIHVVELE